MDWVVELFDKIKIVVSFASGLIPAGIGVLVIGVFVFLVALGVKRVVI